MKWMLGLIAWREDDTACISRKQRALPSARCSSLWLNYCQDMLFSLFLWWDSAKNSWEENNSEA